MTTRNLDALFAPKAIALIGASNEEGSVGSVLARNLLEGGFDGRLLLVNPKAQEIRGVRSFQSVFQLPDTPDLAVIATPPIAIPGLVAELGQRGCRAAVVITAGLDAKLKQDMLAAGRPCLMRIVGPNCLGFISPIRGINASFSHLTPARGGLAFVTQSGAIATSIIDWAVGHDIGFSHLVSLGDMSDVDFGDLLDFLALDHDTKAILLYAETVTQARKFMSAGRIAARAKPVIVVKGGRSRSGAAAATSHTGALAGADAVYDAAFRRAGMLRVRTLRDLFDAAATLASGVRVCGDRLTILTNGGGLGVLAADALELAGGALADLTPESRAGLDRVLPPGWSHANPVDILGDARASRYDAALQLLSDMPGSDALLVMNCPTGVANSLDAAEVTVRAKKDKAFRQPLLGCWMGEASTSEPRDLLSRSGIPNYETPDEAIGAFMQLAEYARNQQALFETPSTRTISGANRKEEARRVIAAVLGEGRSILTDPEAKTVLAAYNIPVVVTRAVASAEAAGRAAAEFGGPVALKILSRDITHKSDVGGVRLNLSGAAETREAAKAMLDHVESAMPGARIDGFTVQKMIRRPYAQELLLGAVVDPTFGPCLMFGQGGIATEIIADRCIGLPPLNRNLALDMVGRTRVKKLLAGYRDRRPADLTAVAESMVSLSQLVIDVPEITELDINPLLADADGVVALDARIIVRPAATADRLAIRPYPAELERRLTIRDLSVRLRPIRPDDASALAEMARRTDPEHLRLRFHGGVSASGMAAVRLSQIDYDREMVFIAELTDDSIGGVVRLVFDPDFSGAECAIIVRTDVQGRTIGRTLLREALAYAQARGARKVWGDILAGNARVVDLARRMGAAISPGPGGPWLVRAQFALP